MEWKKKGRISSTKKKSNPKKIHQQGKKSKLDADTSASSSVSATSASSSMPEADTTSALRDSKLEADTTSGMKVQKLSKPEKDPEGGKGKKLSKPKDPEGGTWKLSKPDTEDPEGVTGLSKPDTEDPEGVTGKLSKPEAKDSEGGTGKLSKPEAKDSEGGTGKLSKPAEDPEGVKEANVPEDLPLLEGLKPLKRGSKLDDVASVLSVPSARKKYNTPQKSVMKLGSRTTQGDDDSEGGMEGSSSSSQDSSLNRQEGSSASSGTSANKWARSLKITADVTTEDVKRKSVDELIPILHDFLTKFIRNGDGASPYYPSQAHAMNARGSTLFTVDFQHLLSNKVYVDIALRIGSENSHEWCLPTVLEFLTSNGFEGQKVVISFTHKPARIEYIEEFMRRQACWGKYMCCSDEVFAANEHGRVGLLAGVRVMLGRHRVGIAYGGNFRLDDLLILDSSKCWLYGEALEANGRNCRLDMSNLWSLYAPFFSISYLNYPLEFDDLIEEMTTVDEGRVLTVAYRDLMYYYPTLAPGQAKEKFVNTFCTAVRRIGGVRDAFLNVIPCGHPSSWSTAMGPAVVQWRDPLMFRKDCILDRVIWHEVDKANGGRQNFKNAKKIVVPFDPTLWGQVLCKRNVLEHADQHGATDDPERIMLYATSQFKHLLGYILRKILEMSKEERIKKYGHVLRVYKKLF